MDVDGIKIESLPSVAIADTKALPNLTAVYLVSDDANRILYAGRSKQLRTRFKTHHRSGDFHAYNAARIYYIPVENDNEGWRIEREIIRGLKPILNTLGTVPADLESYSTETVLLNLKVPSLLREEFTIARRMDGLDISSMLRSFMVRTIREAKQREPEKFAGKERA